MLSSCVNLTNFTGSASKRNVNVCALSTKIVNLVCSSCTSQRLNKHMNLHVRSKTKLCDHNRTFRQFTLRILLRRCSVASNPRECEFESHWRRNFYFFQFHYFFEFNWIVVKHDDINIVTDFWPLFVKKIANSLDFGDFRQISLDFGLSTWTNIEYRIKRSTVTYTLFCFFGFIRCIHFFIRKNQLSIEHSFLICKMYTLINIFGSKSRTLTQQNSRFFYSSTSFAHFV